MSLFVPRISVMADYDAQANQRRADRIAAIRARLADGWRHPAWEAGLYEAERRVRANATLTGGKNRQKGNA